MKETLPVHILSGSSLKLLAITAMLIDHTAAFLLAKDEMFTQPLFLIGKHSISLYFLMRSFGRIAFPIFAFLIVEGFKYTRDHFKYGRNLLMFALLSEIPWNLVHSNHWTYPTQNVFFTLFMGYAALCCLHYLQADKRKQTFCLLLLLAISFVLRADYGCRGFGFIILLYVLRENKLLQAVIGCCFLPNHLFGGSAFIPINLYNGKRGIIKGGFFKYFFYAFYPIHLLVLYFIRVYMVNS